MRDGGQSAGRWAAATIAAAAAMGVILAAGIAEQDQASSPAVGIAVWDEASAPTEFAPSVLSAPSAKTSPPAATPPPARMVPLAPATPATAPQTPGPHPWFVDDQDFYDRFLARLTELAAAGQCLAPKSVLARHAGGKPVRLELPPPARRELGPEEVYRLALPSVLVLGSVYPDGEGGWAEGMYATAWVLRHDGLLVTNWHVFEDLEDGEVFAAADHQGRVYPLSEIVAGDPVADVAILRVAARDLPPLPLARDYPPVGSWVAVLGHPGDNFYVFTTGTVSRYSTHRREDGQREEWMGLTAEFAGGCSGSPVLDRRGAVVGMATQTLTLQDDGGAARRRALLRPRAERPGKGLSARLLAGVRPLSVARRQRDRNDPPPAPPMPMPPMLPIPTVQMVLRMAVPAPAIARLAGTAPPARPPATPPTPPKK